MGTKQRYVIEGTWSGYVARQSRIVHREITDDAKLVAWAGNTAIRYTDGTFLMLSVRKALPRERIEKRVGGYTSLIRECFRYNVRDVAQLEKAQPRRTSPYAANEERL